MNEDDAFGVLDFFALYGGNERNADLLDYRAVTLVNQVQPVASDPFCGKSSRHTRDDDCSNCASREGIWGG